MKKLLLKESQVKHIIKQLISEQSMNNQEVSEVTWKLCSYIITKNGDDFFAENNNGEMLKLPRLSELSATIKKEGQRNQLVFSEDVYNGIEIGKEMRNTEICKDKRPMQYSSASTGGNGGSWFVYVDDTAKQSKEPIPLYGIFTWNGSLGIRTNVQGMTKYKDKDGVTINYANSRTDSFILEVSPALAGIKPNPPKKTPTKQPKEIKLDIQSPFEFDKVTLTPEAEIEFKKFINDVKTNYQGVSGDVEVLSSASIDADENQKRDYNQKLSDNRATTIANRLKTETGITTLNFIPKGIGQTDQFAIGMKYPEVRDTNKTAPNRRLIIKMPTIKK
jgi:outer membrane protein OmpA-like peptidoglycan-associated protein